MSIEDNIDPAARISAIRSVLNDNNAMAHILYKPELRNERSASQALPDSNNSNNTSNDSSTIDPAARKDNRLKLSVENFIKDWLVTYRKRIIGATVTIAVGWTVNTLYPIGPAARMCIMKIFGEM